MRASQSRHVSLGSRLLGGLAGFLAGGFLGFWAMVLVIIFSGEYLGAGNVVPGMLVGGCLGFVLGLFYPRRLTGIFASLLCGGV